ncbi:MAG: hypothetical protein OQL28_04390 [Sedimenticola sp.]|nr:hypothetical protein [Sedimenticola sp.]
MKLHPKYLPFVVLLALFSIPLYADLDAGLKAYEQGDHALAFKHYREAAENGNPDAFGKLAGMYLYGLGTETDYSNAYVWFGLAEYSGDKFAEKFKRTAASVMTLEQVRQAEEILAEKKARLEE